MLATRTWTGSGLVSHAHPDVALRQLDLRSLFTLIAQGDGVARVGFADARARLRSTSQADFVKRAAGLGDVLDERGVLPGTYAVVACPSPEAALTAYIGCVLRGVRPILFATRPGFDSRQQIADNLHALVVQVPGNPTILVQADSGKPAVQLPETFATAPVDLGQLHATSYVPLVPGDPNEIVHLQATSGSTGVPKLAALTSANLTANAASACARMHIESHDCFVSWLPLFHDLGLVGMAMNALVSGTDLWLISPFDFAKNPFGWLKTISEVGGTVTATPNFGLSVALRRVSEQQLQSLDLSSMRRIYCGAEPIDGRLAAEFRDRFSRAGLPHDALRPTYGLAEATLMVAMPHMNESGRYASLAAHDVARVDTVEVTGSGRIIDLQHDQVAPGEAIVVSVGQPGDETGVHLIDEAGQFISEDQKPGEIVVSGPSVTPGYVLADGSLEPFDPIGLRTGDVGFWHKGDLFVIERIKNTIIRNGHNYAPNVLELELSHRAGVPVADLAIIDSDLRPGFGRIVAAVCLPKGDAPEATIAAATAMVGAVEPAIEEVVFLLRTAMPRTTSGKKRYHELRAILAAQDQRVLSRVQVGASTFADAPANPSVVKVPCTSSTAVEATTSAPSIAASGGEVLDLDKIDARNEALRIVTAFAVSRGHLGCVEETTRVVEDLGFDSLAMYEMAVTLEEELCTVISEAALSEIVTVCDLLDVAGAPSEGTESVQARLTRLTSSIPQTYRMVEEQRDRQLLIEGRWIVDFASLNYLGFDVDRRVQKSIAPMVEEWGTHPSWTRAVGSPMPYRQLERELATLVGAADSVVFPSVTLLHFGVLPKLAGSGGTILIDEGAHTSILEAAELAKSRGATIVRVRGSDPADMEAKLRSCHSGPKIIAADGVYSMSGNIPTLREYADLAARYGATLYVDDAHGVGVLGHDPTPENPLGRGGSGVVRHLGLDYDNILYVGGLSKAFSSMGAFITCRNEHDRVVAETASTMIFSGPVPVASLATALAGLHLNAIDGNERRQKVWHLTNRILVGARSLGFTIDNTTGFPCVTVICGDVDNTVHALQRLWKHRILVTPAVFPAMPFDRGGIRLSITAANTDEEVDQLLEGLTEVRESIVLPDHELPDHDASASDRLGLVDF